MYQTVELVLKSYMPKQLEIGMWFIIKINPGTRKEYSEIWALDKNPHETLEDFIVKHGAPVEPYLIYDEQVVAEPHEIGWWDEGDDTDELRDIELRDVNLIINEWDGFVDIEVDEWDFAHEEEINPIIYAEKVTMCLPGMYEEEEEYDDDDDPLCTMCNGSGEGMADGTTCTVCGGSGVDSRRDDYEEDWDDMDDDS